ncbi:hypothetical protein QZH41_019379 [Actinostola sp. cb2023]|nr:hypothetical protein QZH41_019379 [Actinostola sp. cb2023]
MKDQVENFKLHGISAALVGEGQHDPEVTEDVKLGKYEAVFISPELILSPEWKKLIVSEHFNNLKCIVVDEAHCVTQWYVII